jgi:hypothetical protein
VLQRLFPNSSSIDVAPLRYSLGKSVELGTAVVVIHDPVKAATADVKVDISETRYVSRRGR